MLALTLEDFMIELKEGSIQNVGPSTKAASAKLFDVTEASAREFGDKRVKLAFTDEEGNEIEVSLFPDDVSALQADLRELEEDSPVFD